MLEWNAFGRGFDSRRLHHFLKNSFLLSLLQKAQPIILDSFGHKLFILMENLASLGKALQFE